MSPVGAIFYFYLAWGKGGESDFHLYYLGLGDEG